MANLRVREYGHDDVDYMIPFEEQGNGTADWKDALASSETERIRRASKRHRAAARHVAACTKMAPDTYHVQTGYSIGHDGYQATLDNLLIVSVYHDGE